MDFYIFYINTGNPEFRTISSRYDIPPGWRLATVKDVKQFPKEAQKAMKLPWGIYTLADGRIHGKLYHFKVDFSKLPCAKKMIVAGMITIK